MSRERLLSNLDMTEEDMKKTDEITIDDLVEALDILTSIVLGEE